MGESESQVRPRRGGDEGERGVSAGEEHEMLGRSDLDTVGHRERRQVSYHERARTDMGFRAKEGELTRLSSSVHTRRAQTLIVFLSLEGGASTSIPSHQHFLCSRKSRRIYRSAQRESSGRARADRGEDVRRASSRTAAASARSPSAPDPRAQPPLVPTGVRYQS